MRIGSLFCKEAEEFIETLKDKIRHLEFTISELDEK